MELRYQLYRTCFFFTLYLYYNTFVNCADNSTSSSTSNETNASNLSNTSLGNNSNLIGLFVSNLKIKILNASIVNNDTIRLKESNGTKSKNASISSNDTIGLKSFNQSSDFDSQNQTMENFINLKMAPQSDIDDDEIDHVIEKKTTITKMLKKNMTSNLKMKNFINNSNVNSHPVIKSYFTDHKEIQNNKKTMIPIGQLLTDGRILTNENEDTDEIEQRDFLPHHFELYPKWFSHHIPSFFGKSFAKRYYKPYGNSISLRGHIEHGEKETTGTRRTFPHELPQSWLPQQQQQKQINVNEQLPQEFVEMTPGKISPLQRDRPTVNLANAVGEIVEIPDQQRAANAEALQQQQQQQMQEQQQQIQPQQQQPQTMQQQEEQPQEEESEENEEVGEVPPPYMKDVPHELMDRLNPMEYAPETAAGGVNGGVNEHWEDYSTLPHGHHHRHKHNPCYHSPCLNGASCHFQQHLKIYKFKCSCRKGFNGHYCEHVPYSCHPNPCLHGGTCTKIKSGYFCTCLPDYKGHDCDIESACLHNPCLNNGICTETAGGFFCQCGKGYNGKTCEDKLSPCSTNPCKNGATCRDIEEEERFECICPIGFGCIDCSCAIATAPGGSLESSSAGLISLPGSIPSQSSVPGTTSCPINACRNGGSCYKSTSGFTCNCPTGFHGTDCGMPDLCNPNPCENNGVCVQDGEENYKCICPYGFKGADCQTPLACSSHPCMNGATCAETADGYHCKCSLGYKGKKCTDFSPCSRNPCTHKATCIEKGALFTCSCHTGYRGKTCREKDPCVPNPCNNGVCGEINGIVSCNCTHGWMGESCDIENLCQENRCLNGATCVHTLEEFKCVCREGFHGMNCEHHSPCQARPCLNGGVCEGAGNTFLCRCESGFHGERCHLSSHCHPNPCHNGGKCYEGDESYICECQHSYTGRFCEEQHFCLSQPCVNGGSCFETPSSFDCKCPAGNYGHYCEMNVCDHRPCRNGGTCAPSGSTETGFACECVFPYHGQNCDDMDPCLPSPCKNGGTCHSHLQHLHDVSDHILSHSNNEDNVVSVVGPIFNDSIHHRTYQDENSQEVSYLPDASLTGHEVHHFHMTHRFEQANNPSDHRPTYDPEDFTAHHGHIQDPHQTQPSHQFGDDEYQHITRNGVHDTTGSKKSILDTAIVHVKQIKDDNAAKRTFAKYRQTNSRVFKPPISISSDELTRRSDGTKKRDKITNKIKRNKIIRYKTEENLDEKGSLLSRKLDHIPKVIINIRNAESSELVKRTLHDLYICQCIGGYLGAHCQRMS